LLTIKAWEIRFEKNHTEEVKYTMGLSRTTRYKLQVPRSILKNVIRPSRK